ncbi:hypothetical protein N0V90_006632 [Kalmusia sp. IMI 367209]|nr:hypothetical protein N0V90_006632 [Kalmusia sp. IMI 367209]
MLHNAYQVSTQSGYEPSFHHKPQAKEDTNPKSDPNTESAFHINPEWSPDPNNLAPIMLDPISPWNDNGRSQMLDDFVPVPWMNCPSQALDCRRCPKDFRCSLPLSTTSKPPPVVGAKLCMSGAICNLNYCTCPPEDKEQPNDTKKWISLKGWKWLEAFNVYFNPQDAGVSTASAIPTWSLTSQDSVAPVQSTSTGTTIPTRSATHDDTSLPIIPGGQGAIHAPGGLDNVASNNPNLRLEAQSEVNTDFAAESVDLKSIGENI